MGTTKNKVKVLIVDDSDVIRYSLTKFFKEYDFEVVTCNDGMEGIQKAIECRPQLIFLDLMMPNVDGLKMLQVIKMIDTLKKIPIIVISGNTNKSNVLTAIEAGADRVISKPLKRDIIIKYVNELMGHDFFVNLKKGAHLTELESSEIVNQLRVYFLKSFDQKKRYILNGLDKENDDLIRAVVHEIKGTGGTIRYPQLTALSENIERLLSNKYINWDLVKLKCNQIFHIVEEMKVNHPY